VRDRPGRGIQFQDQVANQNYGSHDRNAAQEKLIAHVLCSPNGGPILPGDISPHKKSQTHQGTSAHETVNLQKIDTTAKLISGKGPDDKEMSWVRLKGAEDRECP
jgi:hypothetical protein